MIRNVVVIAALTSAVAALGDEKEKEKDPVREKLFAAKVAYDKEIRHFRKQVEEWLDKREETARKAGDKKTLDLVKEERKTYEENGDLPKSLPKTLQLIPGRTKKKLESVYTEAIKAYTKAGKDELASAVEKELESFRNNDTNSWAALFPPGTYAQAYNEGTKASIELGKDGTFTRVRDGKRSMGRIQFVDGKLILMCEDFVEVWTLVDGEARVNHWSPPKNYPDGILTAKGTAVRSKK